MHHHWVNKVKTNHSNSKVSLVVLGRTPSKLNSNQINKPQPRPATYLANLNNKINQPFLLVVCSVNPKTRLFKLATYLVNNNSPNSKTRLCSVNSNNSRLFLQAAYSANLNNKTNKSCLPEVSLDSLSSRNNSNNNQQTFLEAVGLERTRTRAIHSSRNKMRSILVLLEQTRSSNLSNLSNNRVCSVT